MGFLSEIKQDSRGNKLVTWKPFNIGGAFFGGILALSAFFGSFTTVGPGARAVLVTFGKASSEALDPGLHLKLPFVSSAVTISVRVNRSDVETSSASKDMQEVQTHVALNWSVSADRVVATFMNLGDEEEILKRVISPAVSEVLKAEMAKLTAEEILTKRMELKKAIDAGLLERLNHYGVQLSDLSIVNLSFSKDFTKAVEDKQIAEQAAKQAEYDAQKATQEAKSEVNRAKGKSEAQKLMRLTITSEILQQQAIEKWNGSFPQVMGTGSLPFINLKMKEEK